VARRLRHVEPLSTGAEDESERAFVGGDLLVQAITTGEPDEELFGNFPTYSRYPANA
jgi:hypothetical protein